MDLTELPKNLSKLEEALRYNNEAKKRVEHHKITIHSEQAVKLETNEKTN